MSETNINRSGAVYATALRENLTERLSDEGAQKQAKTDAGKIARDHFRSAAGIEKLKGTHALVALGFEVEASEGDSPSANVQ